jgi:hypothetical protein
VLSVLRYTDLHYPFGIFKLLLPLSLDCPFLIASAVFPNASRIKSYFAILFVSMTIKKRKFKQWWSKTPSISTKRKITSDLQREWQNNS